MKGSCIYHGTYNTSDGSCPECSNDWDNDGDAARSGPQDGEE